MEKIKWLDKVTNEEVLESIGEKRCSTSDEKMTNMFGALIYMAQKPGN